MNSDEKFRARLYDLVEEWTRGSRDPDLAEDTERLRDLVIAMGNKVFHVEWPSSGGRRRRIESDRFRVACTKYEIEDVAKVLSGGLLNAVWQEYRDESPDLFEDREHPLWSSKIPKAQLLLTADVRRLRRAPNVGRKSIDDLFRWRELYQRKFPMDKYKPVSASA